MEDCKLCVHKPVCDLWRNEERQDASFFSRTDDKCEFFLEEQRWIPVTEQLPKLIPCSAGTAYSEAVNVLTSGRKVLTAIWDGTDFIADADFWDAEEEEITHWTPVLLPLPEPMKEDA